MTRLCPHCGSSASEDAIFCRVCGKKIDASVNSNKTTLKDNEDMKNLEKEIDDLLADTTPNKGEETNNLKANGSASKPPIMVSSPQSIVEKEIKMEPIYGDYPLEVAIEQYLIRNKLIKVENKLQEAKKRIDEFLKRIDEEGEILTEDEVKDLKEIVLKIKNKRRELLEKKKPLPYNEELAREQEEIKEKIKKLKNKLHTKKVTKLAYEKLKNEYDEKIKELDSQVSIKEQFEKDLRKNLLQKKKELSNDIEVSKAKLEIGEISEEEFKKINDSITEKLNQIDNVINILK
ncbi:MAG: zinc ribbon domain-containing protein [Candidatus Helarchaeota archaeon]